MIPLKLQLKNFLSYGPDVQEIDFGPYQLICLSGKNGHGKSALLDAITWALWGQARKISGVNKADDGLVKLGQTQMMVILDFACNGQKYRVKREYYKTYGKPYVALDFGVYESEGKVISLTENKLRATQRKIEHTIHLTFDTFANSAFLRQGQANEFSKKSPKDRKEIFSQILGLQQYEIVKKLAMDKAKQSAAEKEGILKFQEKIEHELQKSQEIQSNIDQINKQLSATAQKEKNEAHSQKILEQNIKKLAEEKHNYDILTFKLEQLIKNEKKLQKTLLDIRDQWRSVHKQQLQMSDQKTLEKEKKDLILNINKHQQILQKKLQLKEQYLKHKEQLQIIEKDFYEGFNKDLQQKKLEVEKLQLELAIENKTFKDLIKNQCDKNAEKKQITLQINKIKDTVSLNSINKKELEIQKKQFEKRKEYYQKYITQGNWIKRELDNLKQKQILSQDKGNPSCPLCEQNLSSSRKKFLKAKFTKQQIFLAHRFARLTKIIKSLKDTLIHQHKTINKLKNAEEKNKLLEIQIKESEKKLQAIDRDLKNTSKNLKEIQNTEKETVKTIEIENKELQKLELKGQKQLLDHKEYKNTTRALDLAEKQIKELKYCPEVHKEIYHKLKVIENQITEYNKIHKQINLQEERKKKIHDLCISLKDIKKQKIDLNDQLKQFKDLKNKQQEIESLKKEIEKTLAKITKQKEALLHQKGALENEKNKLKELEKEHTLQKKLIKKLDAQADDYKAIAEATGKNGIQALLIENAIPEVEQEANNILSKLTNNQAQIMIESLRDLKKGGTKETLDIKISDSAGIRQYELFSGGEAFRIDFSLRIAVSKLLARRSGTALQTLIIDEGFGSQDEEGLALIMDALYKIQDDFSKVIIVSHLNTMKDQFPVHFFIEKGLNGSNLKIIKQG